MRRRFLWDIMQLLIVTTNERSDMAKSKDKPKKMPKKPGKGY